MLAVGVSTIQDGVATLGAAYREASLALRRVAAGGGVLSLPDISAFEYLTLRRGRGRATADRSRRSSASSPRTARTAAL